MKFIKNHWSILLLGTILIIAGVAHGYNMFHFPYFENDEGTYISQAWSLLKFGKLAPYTYWYDHAPAGWMLLSLWYVFTGGFFTFGYSIYSGRVFMLLVHVLSTFFLYDIGKRLTKQPWAGVFASLIFSLSPLAVYFQRRVLLDNMMILWILFSFWLLLPKRLTLVRIIFSALCFGIAVLTKENAVFFAPVLFYAIVRFAHPHHKSFAISLWAIIAFFVVSLYLLFAFYNNELLPATAGQPPHVSLVQTLHDQLSRGKGVAFFNSSSDFMVSFSQWLQKDYILIIVGAIASLITAGLSFKYLYFRIPAFLGIFFWVFLLRGGLVIDFYVVPLIPILALNIGILLDYGIYFASGRQRKPYVTLSMVTAVIIAGLFIVRSPNQYTKDETTNQFAGFLYATSNFPKNTTMAIDAFALVDYWEKGYTNAEWFWKLWSDPEIAEKVRDDWRSINYVIASHEMFRTLESNLQPDRILRSAIKNSDKVEQFGPSKETYMDLTKYRSTNGDWSIIYKVNPEHIIVPKTGKLAEAWKTYKSRFISKGQVNDPQNKNTTSEGQAYAMLRAVYMGDQKTFTDVWEWTQKNMQVRTDDHLFAWVYKNGAIADKESATDADLDIAASLALASRVWNIPAYRDEAQRIISDIWKKEVVFQHGSFILGANTHSERETGILVNPSYMSPAWYRIFAEIDKEHPWLNLVSDTYKTLSSIAHSNVYGKGKLVPDWIIVGKDGSILPADSYTTQNAKLYGYDAFRTYFRVAQDVVWYGDKQGEDFLLYTAPVFEEQWQKNHSFPAVSYTDGKAQLDFPDTATAVGAASVLFATDNSLTNDVFTERFENEYRPFEGGWGQGDNYFRQNWAWFGTALLTDQFPNLWE